MNRTWKVCRTQDVFGVISLVYRSSVFRTLTLTPMDFTIIIVVIQAQWESLTAKHEQIQNISRIYEGATPTIIAVTGAKQMKVNFLGRAWHRDNHNRPQSCNRSLRRHHQAWLTSSRTRNGLLEAGRNEMSFLTTMSVFLLRGNSVKHTSLDQVACPLLVGPWLSISFPAQLRLSLYSPHTATAQSWCPLLTLVLRLHPSTTQATHPHLTDAQFPILGPYYN